MKALCKSSPQVRCHFTRLDQVHQLVTAREAIADTGFMARLLTLCSLPRTNPGHQLQYKRANGPYTLIMTAVGQTGLPFGNLPRLLLAQNRPLGLRRPEMLGCSGRCFSWGFLRRFHREIHPQSLVIWGSFPG